MHSRRVSVSYEATKRVEQDVRVVDEKCVRRASVRSTKSERVRNRKHVTDLRKIRQHRRDVYNTVYGGYNNASLHYIVIATVVTLAVRVF